MCPDGDTTLSLHVIEQMSTGESPVVYFKCDELDATVRDLARPGIAFDSDP